MHAVIVRFTLVLSCCALLACSDVATIGALCTQDCGVETGTVDAACAGPACPDGGAALCDAASYPLTRGSLDMLALINRTVSISPWWLPLSDGFNQFMTDEGSRGVGLGLQAFGENCDPQAYATPLVAIAPLPGNAAQVQAAVPASTISTSTVPALAGGLQYARSWAVAHASTRVVLVMLTDARPGACDALTGNSDLETTDLARAAFQDTPSIATYVVGFANSAALGPIARAGGTEPFLISTTPTSMDVLTALRTLRDQARPCTFTWGGTTPLSPGALVTVTEQAGAERSYALQRDSSSCDSQGGFYVSGDTVIACPRTCDSLTAVAQLTAAQTCPSP